MADRKPGSDATGVSAAASAADDELANLGYAQAVAELDRILRELEAEAVDVDVLAQKVSRASALIKLCRERIAGARLEVEHIVADLEDH